MWGQEKSVILFRRFHFCFIQKSSYSLHKVKVYLSLSNCCHLHWIPLKYFLFSLRWRRIDLCFQRFADNSNQVHSNRTSNTVIHTACAICRGCNCNSVISSSLWAKHVEHSLDVMFGWKCLMSWYFELGRTSSNNVLFLGIEQLYQTQHLKRGL